MTIRRYVFAGSSLSPPDKEAFPEIEFLPPVGEADILRLLDGQTAVIGIIDGYFGDRRAVTHKEIVLAMALGVTVFGAASIGALRAVELQQYGMIGVGEVFECYQSGRLNDDGDVALLHGPAEMNYQALTIPLVEVAATLKALEARDRISHQTARSLFQCAGRVHFAERTWGAVTASHSSDSRYALRLTEELEAAHVERKRLDALAMLNQMRTAGGLAADRRPDLPPFTPYFLETLQRAGFAADDFIPRNQLS
ncbi:TfuA-like protein [Pseudoruegeria sp. HB172150]|uniref:TfuA-like protein n=1 Tax=Pseudoruegeria sp. HB172150 TaxID=2721164 RepID=UPI001553AD79|nr:TfuA-like protein [Pseudoruegeria sp. HB172150]